MSHAKMQQESRAQSVWVDDFELSEPHHVDFVRACEPQGYEVSLYRGRYEYVGPSINVAELTEVSILGIDIPLDWDRDGRDYVVHPKVSDNETDARRVAALEWVRRNPHMANLHKTR